MTQPLHPSLTSTANVSPVVSQPPTSPTSKPSSPSSPDSPMLLSLPLLPTSSPNSAPPVSPLPSTPLGTSLTPHISLSTESFNDASPDDLLDVLVHDMTPEQLVAFVQRCDLLRQSAQTRNAEMGKESKSIGATRTVSTKKRAAASPPKNNVALAQQLLKDLLA